MERRARDPGAAAATQAVDALAARLDPAEAGRRRGLYRKRRGRGQRINALVDDERFVK
jgi:hypothetical protein